MIIILWFAFVFPLQFAFKKSLIELNSYFIVIFVNIFFLLDILVNLSTSYFDKGKLVQDKKQIVLFYYKSNFKIDALSYICYSVYLFSEIGSSKKEILFEY